ncbi:MAG: type III-B CRISPR module-associated protein Cmr5 [Acidipropionibacterium sp.]|jgi:CRISPR-associated protein Cmr5|nr:type III-B CRISPR module-associated protein Cmr5 [Acidipropionibacterium sp.]
MTTTRSQRAYSQAIGIVGEVKDLKDNNSWKASDVRKIYIGLWHSFPIMVMSSGLSQAVCYERMKATSPGSRGAAHTRLLRNCADILDYNDLDTFVDQVVSAGTGKYMKMTRELLRVAPYVTHMAEALLDDGDENHGAAGA